MRDITGLSLSFCIRDIAEGRVALTDVNQVISGTAAPDRPEFIKLLASYTRLYWRDCADEAVRVALALYDDGLIDQPRVRGETAPNIAAGHWMVDGVQTRAV